MAVSQMSFYMLHCRLSIPQKMLLMYLGNFASNDGIVSALSVDEMRHFLNLQTGRRVQQLLVDLEYLGEIMVEEGAGDETSKGPTNRYTLIGYARSMGLYPDDVPALPRQVASHLLDPSKTAKTTADRIEKWLAQWGEKSFTPYPSRGEIGFTPESGRGEIRFGGGVKLVSPNIYTTKQNRSIDSKKQKANAIITTWKQTTQAVDPDAHRNYHKLALELVDKDITGSDIQAYIKHLKGDPFWSDKAPSMTHIANNIATWKRSLESDKSASNGSAPAGKLPIGQPAAPSSDTPKVPGKLVFNSPESTSTGVSDHADPNKASSQPASQPDAQAGKPTSDDPVDEPAEELEPAAG